VDLYDSESIRLRCFEPIAINRFMTTTKKNKAGKQSGRFQPLFAFHSVINGSGFLMYQDENGRPVLEGERALTRWRALGCPSVQTYGHAVSLGLAS
jgi:hypothetical protein